MTLLDEALAAQARGWCLTPLQGKVPLLKAWGKQPRPTKKLLRAWVKAGNNLGIRTGEASGLFVVDVDKGGKIDLPETVSARTGSGMHYYFRHRDGLGNSASKLAPHVDTRGEGGQVVLPGSVHPETGDVYEWYVHPDEAEIAEVPEWIVEKLIVKADMTKAAPERVTRGRAWGRAALEAEVVNVANADEGSRNDTLNKAAYSLFRAVAGGHLNEGEVEEAMTAAGCAAGLSESEVRKTIESAKKGLDKPRHPKDDGPLTHWPPSKGSKEVLVPGGHTNDKKDYIEVGTGAFASEVLDIMPDDALYRRAHVVGQVVDGVFRSVIPDDVRIVMDSSVRCVKWVKNGTKRSKVYVPSTKDMAGLVMSAASKRVKNLRIVTSHPVWMGDRWSDPGYNDGGVYDCSSIEVEPMELGRAKAVLEDLVVDFPFAEEASRQNFFGLLLTPIMRPCFDGNVPFHVVRSPQERTGKTKLIEEVLGGVVLGRPTPAMQLSRTEDERDKRILALLLQGSNIVHLDNLGPWIDSPSLASLITTSTYCGRPLGRTEMVEVPNTMTLVGSGNNVQLSSEMAKRCVPVDLYPRSDRPEHRTDFKHPHLRRYVVERRKEALGAIAGLVLNWDKKGQPASPVPMGGFEGWSQTVGGVLHAAGWRKWMNNTSAFVDEADTEGADLRELVNRWMAQEGPSKRLSASRINELLAGLFPRRFERCGSERGRQTVAGQLMGSLVGRQIGVWRIKSDGKGSSRSYSLERVGGV